MSAPVDELKYALEPAFYIDPDVFAHERKAVFARTWQYVGHVSQLQKPGDYFTAEIAGNSIIVLRDRNDELRAFYNVCMHRAHELLQGSGNTRLIVCPYHAWNYELTGELRAGPNLKAVAGFDKRKICLTSLQLDNFLGFLFVNGDPNAAPMDECYPQAREQLAEFVPQINELQPVEYISVEEDCNWKISVENYSECYHCKLNHPTFADGVVKAETYDIQPQGYCLRHTTESQNLDKMSYPIDLNANKRAGEYSSWYLWPTFSFQVYPGNTLNTYHWEALETERVRVTRGWYTVGGEASDVIHQLALQDRDTTLAEDIRLVESVQRGLRSPGYKAGPLAIDPNSGVMSEHSLHAFHNWVREALG